MSTPLRYFNSITLASRVAIAGGMDAERAYNVSDLYILKMDRLETMEEIKALHREMFAFYTDEMAGLDNQAVYSKPVTLCLDYIYEHLHEKIGVRVLAEQTGLNGSYLSPPVQKGDGCLCFGVCVV